MNLKGLRVLVTRPRDRAGPLVQAIEKAGGQVLLAPMLVIEPLKGPSDAAVIDRNRLLLQSLENIQKIIFISVNAVEHGMPLLIGAGIEGISGLKVYAIGKATAEALLEAGIQVHAQADNMNSESLLQHKDFEQLEGESVLVLRGVGGREYLADQMRDRGATVSYLECYRRRAPTMAPDELQQLLAGKEVHAITVNSGETLLHLVQRMKPMDEKLLTVPIVTPSERVSELARAQQFTRVITASNAGIEATLDALQTLAN